MQDCNREAQSYRKQLQHVIQVLQGRCDSARFSCAGTPRVLYCMLHLFCRDAHFHPGHVPWALTLGAWTRASEDASPRHQRCARGPSPLGQSGAHRGWANTRANVDLPPQRPAHQGSVAMTVWQVKAMWVRHRSEALETIPNCG